MPNRVLVQKWEESERGWGTRPDGYSLHRDDAARLAYVTAYNDELPDEVPDEYSLPNGTPYWVDVDDETFEEVRSGNGIRRFGSPPGSGGTDGWVPAPTA